MISTAAPEWNFEPKSNPFKPARRYSTCLNNSKFAISLEYWVVQLRGLVLGKVRLRDTLIPGKGQGRGLPTKNNLQMHNVVLSLNYTVEQILRDTLILGKGQGWGPPWKHYLQILNAVCTRCCCLALTFVTPLWRWKMVVCRPFWRRHFSAACDKNSWYTVLWQPPRLL